MFTTLMVPSPRSCVFVRAMRVRMVSSRSAPQGDHTLDSPVTLSSAVHGLSPVSVRPRRSPRCTCADVPCQPYVAD